MCMSVDYVACKWRCAPFVMLILNKSTGHGNIITQLHPQLGSRSVIKHFTQFIVHVFTAGITCRHQRRMRTLNEFFYACGDMCSRKCIRLIDCIYLPKNKQHIIQMSKKAIVDYTSPALCTPVTPFPQIGDAAYRHRAGGHRQHAQKFGKDRARGSGDILADRQTHRQTSYILKSEASVRLCPLRSQRALTLYTSDSLRCCDRYIRCQRSLAVKPLNSTRDVR